jgi:hypothetical protein
VTTLALDTETPARPTPSFVSAPPALNDLAIRYGTDKRIGIHSYVKWYEALFAPRRWQQLTMLEIGVQTGASIKMWADYFPNARLVGIDIDPRCAQFATNRIQIITGGQENPEVARWLAGAYPGGFDIVIDDGSHVGEHQLASLQLYFPLVKAGGLYIVEDLHCAYSPKFLGNTDRKFTDVLKDLVDHVNLHGSTGVGDYDLSEKQAAEMRPLSVFEREIETITFMRSMAVIQKRSR